MDVLHGPWIKGWLKRVVPFPVKKSLLRLAAANSVEISLHYLRELGFSLAAVIDVGAYVGNWTKMAKRVYPKAKFLMLEAQHEKRQYLDTMRAESPDSIDYEICLLGPEMGKEVTFFVMETGSSIYEELTDHSREPRSLTTCTLDSVIGKHKLPEGPLLLKLDVQGAELDVLAGGSFSLRRTPVILLEVAVVSYNKGAPTFREVMNFLGERGYRLFDIAALMRPDGIKLIQMDAIFVKNGYFS